MDILLEANAQISAFDPEAMDNVRQLYGEKISLCDNQYDVLKQADGLIICTEWSVFRSPDFQLMKNSMKTPIIFDGRNVFDPSLMQRFGFDYYSIGRP